MSRALARLARQLEPEVVHAHWLAEFGWMAAREGLRPLVCSAWGSDVLTARGLGLQRTCVALSGAQLVLADSEHLARAVRKLADVPVEVVRWELDLDAFAPDDAAAARARLGIEHAGPLVASVRGFAPVQNAGLLLESFARLRQRRGDARLLLKWPGQNFPAEIRRSFHRLGLADAVIMLGNVPTERMPDVYRAADVVVSIPSSDSSPRSVWEALACGRPVVVSDLPWAREELEPGRNAELAPLEADAIADAIERALEDNGLGAEGRVLASSVLDPVTARARISELYRSVVESAR
jgi:glycosyltransferase involved in cell wall biosynthesis